MNVLVIGANGKIGKQLVFKLHESAAHEPVAMVRKKSQLDQFEKEGIKTVLADLEEDFSHAFKGNNAVVFTAGSGPDTGHDKTKEVDEKGAAKAIDLAEKSNCKRFIMISAFGADFDPEEWPDKMQVYYEAKANADKHLQQSQLNYTIIKPGRLTNDEGTGQVDYAERTEKRSGSIPREDVADVVVKTLDAENTYKKSLELLSGENKIREAIEKI